ncbi:hypothetical protein [Methanimicrococcus hongohii]|uniref:hypothetical protein n=1 Tax=Methanimicrococcus hongohii TaxID=3028295 RepID=UPI002931BA76|nr:hypothetical protein [Methanimicrococcus sp. Hf6]
MQLSFTAAAPAETANLQLSFTVSAWRAVSVSAWQAVSVSAWRAVSVSACVAVSVSACVAVSVSVCICFFLRNPFAFADVPPLPAGFSFCRYLQVSVSAATYRFLFLPLPTGFCFCRYLQVSVSAATYRFALCRCRQPQPAGSSPPPREPHNFLKITKPGKLFLKTTKTGNLFLKNNRNGKRIF